MAAGTWNQKNKVRPGVYVNIDGEPRPLGSVGERGVVTMALPLSWGKAKEVMSIEAGEDPYSRLGYSLTDPQLLLIKEALKRAKQLLLYRLNAGIQATATVGDLTVTAKYGGVRGNDITLVIETNIDDENMFDVKTFVSGREMDAQTVADADSLTDNEWVIFSGTGELTANAGVPLTGGEDGSVTNEDHTAYLAEIETHDFHTLALTSTDPSLKAVYASFCQRLREEEGKKIQVVMESDPLADYEGIIRVKNGVVLADGTTLTAAQATAWVAGATAGAQANESLTYAAYDGAVDVEPKYTNSQIIAALQNGEFVFTADNGKAVVEQDINSLHTFTPTKGKQFAKNRVLRVLDTIHNDIVRIFSDFYIGKVDNNDDGRNLFKNECVNYLERLQEMGAIQNFSSQDDIRVSPVEGQVDAIYIEAYVQPVDSVEKIYMKVTVG